MDPDNAADASAPGPVAVVGAGGIGVTWTVVFAVRGFEVRLHDVDAPGNPPYLPKVAEIVPAPLTSPETVPRAVGMVETLAMSPVVVAAGIEGFAFNRLPGALLREAYCVVRDGIVSPVDVDTLVREGLGLRWSIVGPFATNELSTRAGLRHHAERHGRICARLDIERSTEDRWTRRQSRRSRPTSRPTCHMRSGPTTSRSVIAMIAVAALRQGFVDPLTHRSGAPPPFRRAGRRHTRSRLIRS